MTFNRFINCTTLSIFNTSLESGSITDSDLVFIESTKQIWTHGTFYSCPYTKEEIDSLINSIDTEVTKDDIEKVLTGNITSHTHNQYLTSYTETDPTVPAWAKAASKPSYSYSEISNTPTSLKNPTAITIQGNGTSLGSYDGSTAKTINVTYSNVGAAAASHTHTKSQITDFPSSLPNPNSLELKVNSGTTEGTDKYTYTGSANKSINIKSGSNVTITPEEGSITISAKDTTYGVATTSSNGLMSSSDKSKLDGIASGANKTVINNTLTSTSTAEALSANQGKVLNDSITSHTGNKSNPHEVTKAQVGLGNVTNESKATMFTNAALTGVPTAPTAASSTNNTQIATTAFVNSVVNNKISAADAMIYKGTIGSTGATITSLPDTTAKTGWTYKVLTAGTYADQVCEVGDMIICLTDGSSSTAATWTVVQSNIDGAVTGPSSSVDSRVVVFNGTTGKVIKDSGFTIGKSVPSNAVFTDTDTKVTSAANHYTPATETYTPTTGSAIGWSGKVVTGITKDSKGHITGVTLGAIPANPNTDTHYTTHLYAGSGTAANEATSNGDTKLTVTDNTTVRDSITIKGTGATSVTSDDSGVITINSTNTTYSSGAGINISGTVLNNSGVRSIATGSANGTISVNTNGTSANVAVKGLGSAAYTASGDYAKASHTHTKSQITDFPSTLPNANALTLKFNSGTTEGTTLYTYTGSAAKTLDIKAGSNVTLTGTEGVLTISATNTDTKYSAGSGLALSGTTFNHASSITAGTVSDDGATRTLGWGGTFKIPSVTYNATGHITGVGTITLTMPSNPNTNTTYTFAGGNGSFTVTPSGGTAQTVSIGKPSTAGTADKVNTTVTPDTGSAEIVRANIAGSDYFRITAGGTASNSGYVEIATGDDGTEPIYVRQYQAANIARSITLLDGSGNTSFPGTVTAAKFSGPLTGNVTGNVSGSSGSCTGNSDTSTRLATARTIDGLNFNGTANITHYGTCSTAAATAEKAVSLANYVLATGSRVAVKFTVTNTAANPTLNINSTGAKAIYYRGAAISAGYLAANRTYEFIYNGTQYELVGDINTDSNTTYTAGNGLTLSDNKFSISNSGVTAGSYGPTANVSGTNGTTINVPQITVDAMGRVTSVINRVYTSVDNNTVYTHPTSSGNKHIPSGGSSGQILRWSADGTAAWGNDNNTTYGIANNTTNGLIRPWYNHTAASTGPTAGSNATAVAVNGISATAGRYYALEMDSNGRGFVNVPWTDNNTTYGVVGANGSTGLVKNGSTVTSASGYTACPIVEGVPYYKDTNTTYTLSSFGITASDAELNYCKGVTSAIQTQLNGKAASSHTHDDRYYTESEMNTKLNAKANTNQNMYIGTTQVAINRASAALTLSEVNVSGSSGSCTGNAASATYVTRDRGSNTVTTLASLPITKSTVIANLSAATSISVASEMNVGESITVICNPTASFTQPIPTTGSYKSMDGSSLSVTSGKQFEINIYCYAASTYSISCKVAK